MPVTVDIPSLMIRNLHEFAVVPNDSFETINHFDRGEYRIDRSSAPHVKLPDLVDMGGNRRGHFEWQKAGKPGRVGDAILSP